MISNQGRFGQLPPAALDAPAATAPPLRVSIVVPVACVHDVFRACLASLDRLDPPCSELIVAVDGGDDDAAALARAHGARVVVLPRRGGPARARNAAARVASGNVLLFVDSDVTLRPDTVGRVAAALAAFPGYDAVIGSYDAAPSADNFLSQYKNLAHHFVHQTSRDEACTFWSACGAVRRKAFDRAGGFNEHYTRSSIEDIELGSRLLAAGNRIRLVKSLQVTHLKRWTPAVLLHSEIVDRAIPWTRLILEAGRMPDDLNLRWSGRVAVLVASLLAASLVAAAWFPWAWLAVVALAALQVGIDARLARFFRDTRGGFFAARAMAWHWVHYLCCAAGFGAGLILHLTSSPRSLVSSPTSRPVTPVAGESESE